MFRNWLGRRTAAEASVPSAGTAKVDLTKQGRRLLLDAICEFLLTHHLPVTTDSFAAAHGAFSGANPPLARQITARLQSGEAITQEWLDQVTANYSAEQSDDAMDRLMGKLEENVDAFSRTYRAAQSATSEYTGQLEQHVIELEQVQDAGQIIAGLAGLAKAMAERTRKLEHDMRRSEEERGTLGPPARQSRDRTAIWPDHVLRRSSEPIRRYRSACGAGCGR
jgi:diguanylate cyclase